MFTGLVQQLAPVAELLDAPPGKALVVEAGPLADGVKIGASIAVSGCCLTVVGAEGDRLRFEAGPETLARTTLGALSVGDPVNLERSLSVGDELGGHFVTGHIDGTGSLARREDEADWSTFWFTAPPALLAQMVSKGSVAIDGVSLTLVDVEPELFSVALIPHTLKVTTLGRLAEGERVNLETDLLSKYVQKSLAGFRAT